MSNYPKHDKFAVRCSKCNTVYGVLRHLEDFNVRICNNCCPTSKFDSIGLFLGCDCKLTEDNLLTTIPGYEEGRQW